VKNDPRFKLDSWEPSESDVLKACRSALQYHNRVAWVQRMNTGGAYAWRKDGPPRFVKFGFRGCSDLIGQLKDGRFLAVEVKSQGENPTDNQREFLNVVSSNGGFAICVDNVDVLIKVLNEFLGSDR
jgi:VRR-NUC domain.